MKLQSLRNYEKLWKFTDFFVVNRCLSQVNFYGFTPVAFTATGFAFPPSAGNFIYGFAPVVLRWKNKC